MSINNRPSIVSSNLLAYFDAANIKSYSVNVFPQPLDSFAWFSAGGAHQATLSRDSSVTDSPTGGIPLKMVTSGSSAYTGTYNSSTWNLAPAAAGQTWTFSFWVKGATAHTASLMIFEANSSGNYTTLGQVYYTVTTSWTRVSGTYTMTQGTTAFVQARIDNYNTGVTMWVDGLQLERSSSVTAFNSQPNINGTRWSDIVGKNNGTLTNSPTYNSSNQGSLLFNGTSNYLTLSSSVGAFGSGNFTISCWWKSNGSQSNYVAIIEQGFTGSPANGAWAFKVSHTSGDFNFTYYNNGISDNLSSYNPNDGVWHNLVAVRTGTTLTLYRDTVSVKTITLPAGFSFGEGSSIFVGYNPRDGSYLKGYLPILQVYNYGLSSSELQQNYNALRGRYGI